MSNTRDESSKRDADRTLRSSEGQSLPDAVSGRVITSAAVLRGLEAVRRSGLTNMLDRPVVVTIAQDLGFAETAHWIESNPEKYSEGIFRGFALDYDER